MSLSDALSDLKNEVIQGKSVDEVADEIARDYGVNPVLLRRKFGESYPNPELLANSAAATSPERFTDKVIDDVCARYGVAREAVIDVWYNGSADMRGRYAMVGRLNERTALGICYENATAWRLPIKYVQPIGG